MNKKAFFLSIIFSAILVVLPLTTSTFANEVDSLTKFVEVEIFKWGKCDNTYTYDEGGFVGLLHINMIKVHPGGFSCTCFYSGYVTNL